MTTPSDRIEKKVFLKAPRARVWRAISDADEFGRWFGVRFEGPFVAGVRATGVIVPTTADPEVAAKQKPHEGMKFDFTVETIEPERLFSFRWHPFAVDPNVDYSKEEATLVVFTLEETKGGTQLTVTESGFDRVPAGRRAKAFAMNEQGWAMQTQLITKYLAAHAS
jgi:uncharacterized protein YndB with AHSA1/START domain